MEPSTVAVVGAGAIGVTASAELATRGVDVTLYERGSLAAGSSGRAAGVCYNAFADQTDARIGDRSLERFRGLC
jgi:glycine/D-amino acid oxidase-like deaminating enzyme